MKLVLLLSAALLSGCGAHRSLAGPITPAADPQIAHADGLLGGFSGRAASQDGQLTLLLVHQTPFTAPVPCATVTVQGLGETAIYLGTDRQLYGRGPGGYYALGSYAGTPAVGAPLRYQLAPGARTTFDADHTVVALPAVPKALMSDPQLLGG